MNKLILILLLCFSSLLQATDRNWQKTNLRIIEQFAIPTYEKLLSNSELLVKVSDEFCSKQEENAFSNLKEKFQKTMDSWQVAQILRSGPAMQNMYFYRLEMWPDRSNAATKHLRKLQQEANPDSLKVENFAKASTAIQGLSALERILYVKGGKFTDFQNNNKANFKCQLIQAISLNIKNISNELLTAWQQNYRKTLLYPSKENAYFESHKAVAAQFLNDLNTQLQVILTQKIKRPLDHNRLRLTRAESWRSKRSLRNIALNLDAVKQLYQTGFATQLSDKALSEKQQALFEKAITQGKEIMFPLDEAYEKHPKKLKQWISAIEALKVSLSSELPKAIAIPLGFNSLDGD